MDAKKAFKELVSRVNQQLWYYEKGWVSVQRYPDSEKIRPETLEEFIEIRFNFEASKIPELSDTILKTEGRLFSCTELVDPDEKKRWYKQAKIKLIDVDDIPDEFNDVKEMVTEVRDVIGGNTICFNGVKRKIKLTIYDDKQ